MCIPLVPVLQLNHALYAVCVTYLCYKLFQDICLVWIGVDKAEASAKQLAHASHRQIMEDSYSV